MCIYFRPPPPKTPTPPPRSPTPPPPATPLPEYIAQFIGQKWFDQLFPGANSKVFTGLIINISFLFMYVCRCSLSHGQLVDLWIACYLVSTGV